MFSFGQRFFFMSKFLQALYKAFRHIQFDRSEVLIGSARQFLLKKKQLFSELFAAICRGVFQAV
jgi:hypothetical protein